MSEELSSLEALALNYRSGVYRISPLSLAVIFYSTKFLVSKNNWYSTNPLDTITDVEWDTIQDYVDTMLWEVKTPMIGMIMAYVTENPPANVLPCDGSTYLRDDYPELYMELDPIYKISETQFTVPDLRGRTIIGTGAGAGLSNRNVGDVGGEEEHDLSESEMPPHSHTIPRTTTTLAVEPGEVAVLSPIPIIPDYTGDTGGGSPHNNMQPYYALNYGVIAS